MFDNPSGHHFEDLPRASGPPVVGARLRAEPEDFQVEEDLGFAPDDAGEHLLVKVRKRLANTEWVARQLAKFAGLRAFEVSYAGLKDRNALTTQSFSLHLGGRPDPDWRALSIPELEIVDSARHGRKLRRGALRGNRFSITLRQIRGEREALDERLGRARREGVPNYFGPQRFGHREKNLTRALALFQGEIQVRDRHQRGLYLSAARAWLFNCLLARRVSEGNWNRLLPGEVAQLEGSHSLFKVNQVDETLRQRLLEGDIHPTGPLWGRGESMSEGQVAELEQTTLEPYPVWRTGLEQAGLKQERRALRLWIREFTWEWLRADELRLAFYLPAGAYATAVLREAARVQPHGESSE